MKRTLVALAALTLLPSFVAAQERDSVRRDSLRAGQSDSALVSDTARGGVEARRGSRNLGLDTDEVRQLQQALNDMGCDAGPVDGIVGPRTRRALQCARQQHNLTSNDLNELFRAMNLSISAEGAAGGAGPSRRRMQRDTTGGMRDTSGMRGRDTTRGGDTTFRRDTTRIGPMRDTTMGGDTTRTRRDTSGRDTTRRDSTGNRPPR